MKIMLLDIDSKIPNLALHKIAKYHQDKGDEVIWNMPIMQYDKMYVSCVFSKNRYLAEQWEGKAEIGGSGYSLDIVLPCEIESVKPHINLGFTTRGCIRNCDFCVVPKKEGKVRIVGDLLDIWDGKAKDVILMDNNILALPEHFKMICEQAISNKIRIDFNQGLDHRLLTPEICDVMSKVSHKEYRFAFDKMSYLPSVKKAISLLKRHNINRAMWYVLVGFDTSKDEDLIRCNYLRNNGQSVFVQRYNSRTDRFYNELASWTAQHGIFSTHTWQEYCLKRKRGLSKDNDSCASFKL